MVLRVLAIAGASEAAEEERRTTMRQIRIGMKRKKTTPGFGKMIILLLSMISKLF